MAIIGCIGMGASVLWGLYVGLYLMFIKGIIQVVTAIRAEVLPVSDLTWGIVKIVFATPAGYVVAVIPFYISSLIWVMGEEQDES